MAQFYFLVQIVAPVFVVMAFGYLMRKIGILSSEADRSLTRLVVTLLAPSLAFDTIIGNDAPAKPANWILPPSWALDPLSLESRCPGGVRNSFGFPNAAHGGPSYLRPRFTTMVISHFRFGMLSSIATR